MADRRRSAGRQLLFEEIALGEDTDVGVAQPEAAGQMACCDQHRRATKVIRVGDRPGANLIVGEQLDRSLGAPGRRRHEEHGVALLLRGSDFIDPIADSAVVGECGSARHVTRVRRIVFNRKL